VIPFLLLIMSSLTAEKELLTHGYSLFPRQFGLDAYAYIVKFSAQIMRGYGITIFVTTVGTLVNVMLTVLLAYPLSRKELPGRNVISFFIFFTMLFNGGFIPSYLMWTQYFHIKDTIFALIVPNLLLGAFYIIMMRAYIQTNIPNEIIEAAYIDGAGEMIILKEVVIPLSKPIMATVALLVGLSYWNDWMNGLYYLVKRTDLFSIQNILNTMIRTAEFLNNTASTSQLAQGVVIPTVGVRMAIAAVTILPILIVYPFFQNSFVKGIIIGGVKG
jgi:putative aldouronate transport system permease protein